MSPSRKYKPMSTIRKKLIKTPKKPKIAAKKKSKHLLEGKSSSVIAVEIENGKKLYFNMDLAGDGFERIEEESLHEGDVVFTCFGDDWRRLNPPGRKLSARKASSNIMRKLDIMEELSIINRSNKGVVYATRKSQVVTNEWIHAPLMAQLDQFCRLDNDQPYLVTISLGNLDLIIFILYNEKGHVGEKDIRITISPNDVESAITSFVTSKRLPDDIETIVLTQNDLSEKLRSTPILAFPKYGTVLGISYNELLKMVAMATWGIGLTCGAWAFWEYQSLISMQEKLANIQSETVELSELTGHELSKRLISLAQYTEMDIEGGFKIAEELYQSGSRVQAKMDSNISQYSLYLPLAPSNKRDKMKVKSLKRTAKAIQANAPDKCKVSGISINGALNEIQKDIICQRPNVGSSYGW